MKDIFFSFFNPQTGIISWRNQLEDFSIIFILLSILSALVYYLVLPYNTKSNKSIFYSWGVGSSLLIGLVFFIYLISFSPISGTQIKVMDAIIVCIHIFGWSFVIYFLFSLIVYRPLSLIKDFRNGFLHKKTIPF